MTSRTLSPGISNLACLDLLPHKARGDGDGDGDIHGTKSPRTNTYGGKSTIIMPRLTKIYTHNPIANGQLLSTEHAYISGAAWNCASYTLTRRIRYQREEACCRSAIGGQDRIRDGEYFALAASL